MVECRNGKMKKKEEKAHLCDVADHEMTLLSPPICQNKATQEQRDGENLKRTMYTHSSVRILKVLSDYLSPLLHTPPPPPHTHSVSILKQ